MVFLLGLRRLIVKTFAGVPFREVDLSEPQHASEIERIKKVFQRFDDEGLWKTVCQAIGNRYRNALRSLSTWWYLSSTLTGSRSIENYHILHGQKSPRYAVNPPDLPLRLRAAGRDTVFCRPDTTDIKIFDQVFKNRYHLPPNDIPAPRTILDLGSNIGLTLVSYAALFPGASMLGIELDRGNYELCVRNTDIHRNRCSVMNGAVWSVGGLRLPYGGSENWGYGIGIEGETIGTAGTYTIANLLDHMQWSTVDFMKVDIEGAEKEIFKDGSSWARRVRCLKVEVHSPYSLSDCVLDLERAGFRTRIDPYHPQCVVAYDPGFRY